MRQKLSQSHDPTGRGTGALLIHLLWKVRSFIACENRHTSGPCFSWLSLQPKSNFSVARRQNRKYASVRRWGHSLDSYMWHTSCINASHVTMRAFKRKHGYLSHIFLQRSGLKTGHIAVCGHEMLIMCPSSSSASFSRQGREKRENTACTRKGVLVTITLFVCQSTLAYLLIEDKVTKQKNNSKY